MGVKVREKKKGSGEWWIFIHHNGKRKAKRIGKDKRVALEVAKKIDAKIALGQFQLEEETEENSVPAFSEYAATWIETIVPATCKPSTIIDYRSILDKHVLPVLGKKPVSDINRMMVKKFLMGKVTSGLSTSTVSYMKSCISGVLNVAVDDEMLVANPAHRLGKIFKKKNTKDDIVPYSREELGEFLKLFHKNFPEHYPMLLTLARTGMRIGEVTALQWDDIDFENRSIHVQRTFSRGDIGTPKSGKDRLVDMSNQLSKVLHGLKEQRKIDIGEKGWKKLPQWVFVNEVGSSLDIHNWRNRIFYKAIETSGLKKIRIHDLRHTYASLLIEAGESLTYIRDQLGHHSISFTVDIYGHLTPGGNKSAVDRLDNDDED